MDRATITRPQLMSCKRFASTSRGIFAHGFARARRGDCGHDFLIAFSCKGRAVCPSCNTRRMALTAAHLTDHVFPHLPVRQWVLSVPKRLRYFLQRDGDVQDAALRILMRVIKRSLGQKPWHRRVGQGSSQSLCRREHIRGGTVSARA